MVQVLIFIQQPNNLNNIGLRQSHLADLEVRQAQSQNFYCETF